MNPKEKREEGQTFRLSRCRFDPWSSPNKIDYTSRETCYTATDLAPEADVKVFSLI